ncbi:MAG: hypothetical protein RL653_1301 [Pseudomonadota bacterium]
MLGLLREVGEHGYALYRGTHEGGFSRVSLPERVTAAAARGNVVAAAGARTLHWSDDGGRTVEALRLPVLPRHLGAELPVTDLLLQEHSVLACAGDAVYRLEPDESWTRIGLPGAAVDGRMPELLVRLHAAGGRLYARSTQYRVYALAAGEASLYRVDPAPHVPPGMVGLLPFAVLVDGTLAFEVYGATQLLRPDGGRGLRVRAGGWAWRRWLGRLLGGPLSSVSPVVQDVSPCPWDGEALLRATEGRLEESTVNGDLVRMPARAGFRPLQVEPSCGWVYAGGLSHGEVHGVAVGPGTELKTLRVEG